MDPKQVPLHNNAAELDKNKDKNNKKKKLQGHRQKRNKRNPAIDVNNTDALQKKKKKHYIN